MPEQTTGYSVILLVLRTPESRFLVGSSPAPDEGPPIFFSLSLSLFLLSPSELLPPKTLAPSTTQSTKSRLTGTLDRCLVRPISPPAESKPPFTRFGTNRLLASLPLLLYPPTTFVRCSSVLLFGLSFFPIRFWVWKSRLLRSISNHQIPPNTPSSCPAIHPVTNNPTLNLSLSLSSSVGWSPPLI
ncbi:hypothetical protein P170DRAFT_72197 [Aspergillus steynii IBT 23096]|uniref:Uncharacterized protein n=1 Tax=Aspergillus steynii IBT 23096 TaxID=1392250 RepID=A0A2I2FR79_9EURO|nr:uncharacterized protein P170DRAFT_72197 [Aspergillus steynii IBT 23096]PLB43117.1 hypothetical protein P170DRAFT_72197 [Aspergillus steynii IBT 23096]